MIVGIFGTGRNGSSLLTRLLDGIPETYVHPIEVIFLSALHDLEYKNKVTNKTIHFNHNKKILKNVLYSSDKFSGYYQKQIDEIIDNFSSHLDQKIFLNKDYKIFSELKKKYSADDFINHFFSFVSNWALGKKTKNYIFKTSEVSHLENYKILFPNMKFIHLFRDPVNVYDSMIRQSRERLRPLKRTNWYIGGDSLLTVIKRWKIHSNFVKSHQYDKNHYIIKYENLINDPEHEINKITSWLGLEPTVSPTISTILSNNIIDKLPPNVGMNNVETPVEVINNMSKKYNYKFSVESSETSLIQNMLYKNARFLGYSFPKINNSKVEIIKDWILPKMYEFQNSKSIKLILFSILRIIVRRFKILFIL